jgi:hypothetical protein
MVKRDISFSSALMKIVDEILVTLDSLRTTTLLKSSTTSKIHIDIGVDGWISS